MSNIYIDLDMRRLCTTEEEWRAHHPNNYRMRVGRVIILVCEETNNIFVTEEVKYLWSP